MPVHTVILKAVEFENDAVTTQVHRANLGDEVVRVIEYPSSKYHFVHADKFEAVLPEVVPKAITAILVEDNKPFLTVTVAESTGLFVLGDEHSAIAVNFNDRTITINHDRIFPDYRVTLNFHYAKEASCPK